jgi:hypothetical protein
VSRIFVGLTDGFFKHPTNDGQLSTEDVVENLELIRDTANYLIPASNQDEFQKLGAKLLA